MIRTRRRGMRWAVLAVALSAAACGRRGAPADVPGSGAALRPMTLEYAYTIRGAPQGGATYTLERDGGAWKQVADVRYGTGERTLRFRTELRFSDALAPLESLDSGPGGAVTRWRAGAGRMIGERSATAARRDTVYDVPVPAGTLFDLMDEQVLKGAGLEVGKTVTLPVLVTRAPRRVTYTVTAAERVTVPAGTFDAFRVEVRGKPGVSEEPDVLQVWHLTRAAPHVAIRQEVPSAALLGELSAMR